MALTIQQRAVLFNSQVKFIEIHWFIIFNSNEWNVRLSFCMLVAKWGNKCVYTSYKRLVTFTKWVYMQINRLEMKRKLAKIMFCLNHFCCCLNIRISFDHVLFLSLQVSSPCIFTWLWVLWVRCWMSCQSCGYWLFATPCGSRADTSRLLLRTGSKFCTMYTVCFYVMAWTCLPPLRLQFCKNRGN